MLGYMPLNLQIRSEAHYQTRVIQFHACKEKNLELAEQELSSGLGSVCLTTQPAQPLGCAALNKWGFFSSLSPDFLLRKYRIIIFIVMGKTNGLDSRNYWHGNCPQNGRCCKCPMFQCHHCALTSRHGWLSCYVLIIFLIIAGHFLLALKQESQPVCAWVGEGGRYMLGSGVTRASFVSCQSHQYRPRPLGRPQNYRPVAISIGYLGLGSEGVYMLWAQWSLIIECYGNFSFMDHLGTLNQRPNLILDLGLGQETWTGLSFSQQNCWALSDSLGGTALKGNRLEEGSESQERKSLELKKFGKDRLSSRAQRDRGLQGCTDPIPVPTPFLCPLPPWPLPQRML